MKKVAILILIAACFAIAADTVSMAPAAPEWDFEQSPFSEKLIFSETPEIGKKWRGGIRWTDILVFEGYFNVGGWMTIDVLRAGLSKLKIDTASEIVDYFSVLTLKSFPLSMKLMGDNDYKVAGGLKIYNAPFHMLIESDSLYSIDDQSAVLFLTQSFLWNKRHYFNLFTSLSFRSNEDADGNKVSTKTYYIVPGYKIPITKRWYFGIEYYMTNTMRLPLKILQFVFDDDQLDFFNTARDMYSFMFFGCHYAGKHLRIDLNIASHITFQSLILPVFGIGWNF